MNERELTEKMEHIKEIRYSGRFRGIKKSTPLIELATFGRANEEVEGSLSYRDGEFWITPDDHQKPVAVFQSSIDQFIGWKQFFVDDDDEGEE